MLNFENKKNEFLRLTQGLFPDAQIVLKIGYGSGFIWQDGNEQLKDRMMDLLLVVKNLEEFHFLNKSKNPSHYKKSKIKSFFSIPKSALYSKVYFSFILFH